MNAKSDGLSKRASCAPAPRIALALAAALAATPAAALDLTKIPGLAGGDWTATTPSSSSSSTRTSPSSRMLRRTARGPKSQPKPDHNDATLAVCV